MSTPSALDRTLFDQIKRNLETTTPQNREARAYDASIVKIGAGLGTGASLLVTATAALRTLGGGKLAPFVVLASATSSLLSHEIRRVAENVEEIESESTVRKTALRSSEQFVNQLTKNTICLPLSQSTFIRILNRSPRQNT